MTSESERVREALKNTPPEYLTRCLLQRVPGPQRAGSFYPVLTAQELLALLEGAEWTLMGSMVGAVKDPAVAFKAMIPGLVDMVPLDSLDPSTPVVLADPKGTGMLEATIASSMPVPSEHTVLIVGPYEQRGEIVWTFFPGNPIGASALVAASVPENERRITAAQARNLGLFYAKATGALDGKLCG